MADDISKRLLEDALEGLPEAVAIFDAEDRFVFWNGKFQEIYGAGVALEAGVAFADHLSSTLANSARVSEGVLHAAADVRLHFDDVPV